MITHDVRFYKNKSQAGCSACHGTTPAEWRVEVDALTHDAAGEAEPAWESPAILYCCATCRKNYKESLWTEMANEALKDGE